MLMILMLIFVWYDYFKFLNKKMGVCVSFLFSFFKIPMFNYFLNISYLFGMDMLFYLMFMLGNSVISFVYISCVHFKNLY